MKNKKQLGYIDGLIYEIQEMRKFSRQVKREMLWLGIWEKFVWSVLLIIVVSLLIISLN